MDENKFIDSEAVELTLEECFPTASPAEIERIRKQWGDLRLTSTSVVTRIDDVNKEIWLETVANEIYGR